MKRCAGLYRLYRSIAQGLEHLGPVSMLLFRLWVAVAFWRAGIVKVSDMSSTVMLFTYLYHVPLLPPIFAAYLGTFIELVSPWFLGMGLLGRVTALFLFIYDIIAVVSYPALWPHGLWAGFWSSDFMDHKVWGMMLLAVVAYGPGTLSVDGVLHRWIQPRRDAWMATKVDGHSEAIK